MQHSSHYYIDGTFITTKDYYQLIVVMYYDIISLKKIPGAYILINNKYQSGYTKTLLEFKRILTIENTYKIDLKSITIDFEISLWNSLNIVFPTIKLIGCYFHFIKQVRLNLGKKGLLINEFAHEEFLKEIAKFPFIYFNNPNCFDEIFNQYKKLYINNEDIIKLIKNFEKYFKDTWIIFFKNNMLNYNTLKKFQRCNSYIENYNKKIKEKLGKYNNLLILSYIGPYLGYRGFSVVPWPIFLTFIINEENYYKNLLFETDSKFKKKDNIIYNKIISNNNNYIESNIINNENIIFLKYQNYSCRYDSFFLIQCYVINNYIKNKKIIVNDNLKLLYDIGEKIINLNHNELNLGFWEIINKYNLDTLGICDEKNGYKDLYPVSNIFNFLKNIALCCIKRKENIVCINCGTNTFENNVLNPLISINMEKLKMNNIIDVLNSLSEPFSSSCIICSFNPDESIKSNIYYQTCKQTIVKELEIPNILFFIFDLSTENESDENQYLNLIKLRNEYKKFIVASFHYKNNIYKLSGTINQTSVNHYTACIISNKREINGLLKNYSYYYDGYNNNNRIIELNKNDNFEVDSIIKYNPLIIVYLKE